MANDRKDVELRIKGVDESGKAFETATKNVGKITTALKGQAAAAEAAADAAAGSYTEISKGLDAAVDNAVKARRAYDELAKSLAGNTEPTRKQVREFTALGNAAEAADKKVDQFRTRLQTAGAKFDSRMSIFEQVLGDDAARAKAEQGSLRLLTAIDEVQTAQARLTQLSAFRTVGADAEASAKKLGTFQSAANGLRASTDSLSSGLLSILDPARSARSSLAGLEGEVDRVSAVVGDASKPLYQYQDAINDLGRIQDQLLKQGAAVDAYKQQATTVGQAQAAFEAARADVVRYAQAIQQADAPNDALTANLRQAEAAFASTSRELESQRGR